MAIARRFRLELIGDRDPVGQDLEIWQCGITLIDSDSGGVFPRGIKESLPTVNVVTTGENENDGVFDWYWAWEGTQKMTRAVQKELALAARNFWNSIKANASTDHALTAIRINAVQADGKVVNGANMAYLQTPIAGQATGSSQLPPQIAVVMSLRTGARGAGGRGRMYLPLTGSGLNDRGRIGSVPATTLVASGKAFLEALHVAGPLPVVANEKANTYSAITGVQIGNIFDTQRRRRNSLTEVYTAGDLSYN